MPTPSPVPVAGQLILASWGATVTSELAALSSRYVAVPTPWVGVTFLGAWVNSGGAYNLCQYRKTGDVVEMRGVMKSGAIGGVAFILPVGFRPPADFLFPSVSNSAFGYLWVTALGQVTPAVGSPVSFGINCSFSVTA